MNYKTLNPQILEKCEIAEEKLVPIFKKIDKVAEINTYKVMTAFRNNRVSEACFAGTTGYGYDDLGRETLDKIYAEVFSAEKALVRIGFVNGTHALSAALYGLLKPGETMLSVTGTPYDSLRKAIGIGKPIHGSLAFYGINYDEVGLIEDNTPNYELIKEKLLNNPLISLVFIQRSRGYENRKALSVSKIGEIINYVKSIKPKVNVMVDNCYGEFTETIEPTDVGADIIAGSLIKNPGGGLAPTGAYIAGKEKLIDNIANVMTCPGIGGECGSTLGNNRLLYQGFFMAPHIVAQALKTACFAAAVMQELGFNTSPAFDEERSDIIQMITFNDENLMNAFCKGIQAGSPVDSYVVPVAWDMPGYDCPIIMAAGTFIQGSSIELSADGRLIPPYIAYMQGGITYESGKLGVLSALDEIIKLKNYLSY